MKRTLSASRFCLVVVGLSLLSVTPVFAQAIELGDGIQIDLNDDTPELRPRVSSDGERVNVEVYEDPEPETQIRISDDRVDVQQVDPPPEQRLDLTVPFERDR